MIQEILSHTYFQNTTQSFFFGKVNNADVIGQLSLCYQHFEKRTSVIISKDYWVMT